MVIAYHLVWTAYGWWLPNDPRGSMSRTVESDIVAQLGELHYGRKRVQPASREIRVFYAQAAQLLKFPLVTFDDDEIQAIARAFAQVMQVFYTCYACAIMHDHIHIVLRKHRDPAEDMIERLQDASRVTVIDAGHRHFDHPVWGGCGYKVFLDTPEDVRRTIRYVEQNPVKARRSMQKWSFVTEYDNWPFRERRP